MWRWTKGWKQVQQQVDVISDSSDLDPPAADVLDDSADVRPTLWRQHCVEEWDAVFRAEDEMREQRRESVTH